MPMPDEQSAPSGVSIRPAREEDRGFVCRLVPSLLEFGSPIWEDPEALAPGFRAVLDEAVRAQDRDSTVLIAEGLDKTPLGFISITLKRDVAGVERAHVADLGVVATARRTGIGTMLMNAAESWAQARGLNVVSLDVWSTNERALAFYRHHGYASESLHLIKRLDETSR